MKAPPRGYHYVQDDKGDIILAAIATGLIAAIIASN
jgi:Ni/Co efflux regulator RcnB